ncbi:MAG TPA: glycosyltransferase family 2 protein [Candidatus Omnitrophota bacterium]|nr:glycosyltransferase family 2 protein [Candidatus Omnitrophota bacterium]
MPGEEKNIFELLKEKKKIDPRYSFKETTAPEKDDRWPRITVVTPSYGQGKYLESAILSVIGQGYPNLEYIVIDGGSTDNSAEIIKKYAKYISYWISEKDNGQADAVRKGLEKSTGSIMAWLNADDMYAEGTLFKVADHFKHNRSDVVYGDEYVVDETNVVVGDRRTLPFPPDKLALAFFMYGGFWTFQTTTFWRRSIYEKAGGIDPHYFFSLDVDLFSRYVLEKASFSYLRSHLAYFRIHENSKSYTRQDMCLKERRQIIAKFSKNIPLLFRNRSVMRALGAAYFYRHLFAGSPEFILYEGMRRTGIIKKHPLMPY